MAAGVGSLLLTNPFTSRLDPSSSGHRGNPSHGLKRWDFFLFLPSFRRLAVPVICHFILRICFWLSEYMISTEKRKLDKIVLLIVEKYNVVAVLLVRDHLYFPPCSSMILRPYSWQVAFFCLVLELATVYC